MSLRMYLKMPIHWASQQMCQVIAVLIKKYVHIESIKHVFAHFASPDHKSDKIFLQELSREGGFDGCDLFRGTAR